MNVIDAVQQDNHMDKIVHIFNVCIMTRLLVTLKQLNVIEYCFLNTLNT